MYRRYRVGDLPDIQIKHSELIAPLQAVAQVSKSDVTKSTRCSLYHFWMVCRQNELQETKLFLIIAVLSKNSYFFTSFFVKLGVGVGFRRVFFFSQVFISRKSILTVIKKLKSLKFSKIKL